MIEKLKKYGSYFLLLQPALYAFLASKNLSVLNPMVDAIGAILAPVAGGAMLEKMLPPAKKY